MHTGNLSYGPRLVADPTGSLRAAVVVTVPASIEEARPLAGEPNAVRSRAIAQQNVLIKTLSYYHCEVTMLESLPDDPYASAVADAAVMFENGAVMMRSGSMTRRPESLRLETEFEKRDFPIAGHIAAPGLLDGGDVLMAGNTAFVGIGPDGNAAGRAGFEQIARAHGYDVVEVQFDATAGSLRRVAGVVARDCVVLAPADYVDHAAFKGFRIVGASAAEQLGAGVLNLGERHVLADVRFPEVNAALRAAGATVDAIDLYEFSRIGIPPSMLALGIKRG